MANSMASRGGKHGVGVIGGSGYIGAELLRYLAAHPNFDVRWASADSKAGAGIADVLPNLHGAIDDKFMTLDGARERMSEVQAVLTALPHDISQSVIPELAEMHPETVFVDMARDFRSADTDGYERFYGHAHQAPELLPEFVYGLTEFQRKELDNARLIANPGCFATAILMVLAPLARAGVLRGNVYVTAITGSSGAGKELSAATHHPERAANVRAYKVLAHQHMLEINSFLRSLTGEEFEIHFVPQGGPFVRGIFATLFIPDGSKEVLAATLQQTYEREALVSARTAAPELRWVQGSPRTAIGVVSQDEQTVFFSAIDNLGKGAAGQAIQNLNRAFGLPETSGLEMAGGFV